MDFNEKNILNSKFKIISPQVNNKYDALCIPKEITVQSLYFENQLKQPLTVSHCFIISYQPITVPMYMRIYVSKKVLTPHASM